MSWRIYSRLAIRHRRSLVSSIDRCSLDGGGGTFFLVDSDDSQDLFFADFHGSVNGFTHGGGVLVDGHHSDFVVVL